MNIDIKIHIKTEKQQRRLAKRLDKAIDAALKQSLAYTMTTSRRTLRKRKKPSPPGSPPHRKVSQKEGFGFQRFDVKYTGGGKHEGIVGPTRFPRSRRKTPPSVNEFGGWQLLSIVPVTASGMVIAKDGTVPRRKKGRDGKMYNLKGKRRRAKVSKFITVPSVQPKMYNYPMRKFQLPALKKVIKSNKIPVIFAEQIHRRVFREPSARKA